MSFPIQASSSHNVTFLFIEVSTLQSEITLSTADSEFIVLYMATQELIPLHHLIMKLHKHALFTTQLDPTFPTMKTYNVR